MERKINHVSIRSSLSCSLVGEKFSPVLFHFDLLPFFLCKLNFSFVFGSGVLVLISFYNYFSIYQQ